MKPLSKHLDESWDCIDSAYSNFIILDFETNVFQSSKQVHPHFHSKFQRWFVTFKSISLWKMLIQSLSCFKEEVNNLLVFMNQFAVWVNYEQLLQGNKK